MFSRPEKNGFDIVIGNPPYFVLKNGLPFKDNYEAAFPQLKSGRTNIYQMFMGLSAELLNKNGIFAFIHPKTLLSDAYLEATRNFLVSQFNDITILNIENRHDVFNNVLQAVIVSLWHKGKNQRYRIAQIQSKKDLENSKYMNPTKKEFISKEGKLVVVSNIKVYKILDKINSIKSNFLNFRTGSLEWNKYKKNLSGDEKTNSVRLLYGENIQRYTFAPSKKRSDSSFLTDCEVPFLMNPTLMTQRTTSSEQEWRIFAHLINPIDFSCKLTTENSTNVCVVDSIEEGKYYLAFFNSKFADFYFRLFNSNTHVSSGELNAIPIPTATQSQQQEIITLVDQILAAKKTDPSTDTAAQEAQIDQLVYKLYDLTDDEIKIVEEKQ